MRVVSLLNSGANINTVGGLVCYYQYYDHVDDVDITVAIVVEKGAPIAVPLIFKVVIINVNVEELYDKTGIKR